MCIINIKNEIKRLAVERYRELTNKTERADICINYFLLNLGDSLGTSSNTMYFSTTDNDNDKDKRNCAEVYKTAGWFSNCFRTNLNGPYKKDSNQDAKELSWYDWGSTWRSLKSAKMMIRPM